LTDRAFLASKEVMIAGFAFGALVAVAYITVFGFIGESRHTHTSKYMDIPDELRNREGKSRWGSRFLGRILRVRDFSTIRNNHPCGPSHFFVVFLLSRLFSMPVVSKRPPPSIGVYGNMLASCVAAGECDEKDLRGASMAAVSAGEPSAVGTVLGPSYYTLL